jgi:3-hydroxyisobutyrate dehydrogenase
MIAFLGMGLLGGNFVRALRSRGEEVRVWNRTRAKADELTAVGAVVADSPADAVRGATRVHIVVSDDAAVDDVLAQAALEKGATVVDHTTTTPTGTAARAARFAAAGITYLHAPVFMGPKNALESTGIMLSSGDRATFDRLAPELSKMTGTLSYVGPQPERAAGLKLLGNLFLVSMIGGLVDMFALAKAMNIPAAEALGLFDLFNPGASLPGRAKSLLRAEFSKPSWELTMARKDARLMMEEASRGEVPLVLIPALAAVMDRFIAEGHGQEDWTVIGKEALTP